MKMSKPGSKSNSGRTPSDWSQVGTRTGQTQTARPNQSAMPRESRPAVLPQGSLVCQISKVMENWVWVSVCFGTDEYIVSVHRRGHCFSIQPEKGHFHQDGVLSQRMNGLKLIGRFPEWADRAKQRYREWLYPQLANAAEQAVWANKL